MSSPEDCGSGLSQDLNSLKPNRNQHEDRRTSLGATRASYAQNGGDLSHLFKSGLSQDLTSLKSNRKQDKDRRTSLGATRASYVQNGDDLSRHFKRESLINPPSPADDDSVSEFSTFATLSSTRLIALLMDPVAKCYEILQLEFPNADGAIVQDILAQIKEKVTHKLLRSKEWVSVCLPHNKGETNELLNSLLLSYYKIESGDTVIAVPKGLTGKQCIKLAVPLINGPQMTKIVGLLEKKLKKSRLRLQKDKGQSHTHPRSSLSKNRGYLSASADNIAMWNSNALINSHFRKSEVDVDKTNVRIGISPFKEL